MEIIDIKDGDNNETMSFKARTPKLRTQLENKKWKMLKLRYLYDLCSVISPVKSRNQKSLLENVVGKSANKI